MDVVREVLAREYPEREPTAIDPVQRGNRKRTTVVTFVDGPSVVVQVGPEPERIRTETVLARVLRERTSIPVPRVLATGRIGDEGYAVVERIQGTDLHERFVALDPEARQSIARTFGRYLAEIHEALVFDAYGPVTAEAGAPPDGTAPEPLRVDETEGSVDWSAWFGDYAREGIDALPPSFDDLRDPMLATVTRADLPDRPISRLYPWDFRPGNALVADDDLVALVDWGDPLAAPPALSMAKAEHLVADWYVEDSDPLREAFRAGYGSVRPAPVVPGVYRLVAVVRSAVDSKGEVTRPRFPELTGEDAVDFHRERLTGLL